MEPETEEMIQHLKILIECEEKSINSHLNQINRLTESVRYAEKSKAFYESKLNELTEAQASQDDQ